MYIFAKNVFMLLSILKFFKNKYLLVITIFVIWIVFFDKNNLISHIELHQTLKQLKADKKYYNNEIAKDSTAMEELMTNPKNLEKFAREKYLMKKDDEEVFVIMTEEGK